MSGSNPHILLINPWIHDFSAYDFWGKPLGLLTLGSILREKGFTISYIDCLDRFHPNAPESNGSLRYGRGPYLKTPILKPSGFDDVPRRFSRYGIQPEWFREFLTAIHEPDLVLVTSGMTYWWTGVKETIMAVKTIFPKTPVVLGGIYATLCRAHAVRFSGADVVISGSGEDRIVDLASQMSRKSPNHPRDKGRFDPKNIDSFPFPAFDLYRKLYYIPLLTSVGCPFSCAYCASHLLNQTRMRKSPERVLEEIRYWNQTRGIFDFVLYDDAFLVDSQAHAIPILSQIIDSGLPLRFHTPNALHVRGISDQIARLMFKTGFKTVRLGLETAVFEKRGSLDRKVDEKEFHNAVSALLSAGFEKDQVGAYLLTGLPDQNISDLKRSIRIVKEYGIQPVLAYYTPIPKTALWDRAVTVSRYPLEADPVYTNNAVFPCRKETFSWDELSALKALISDDI